MIATHPKVPTKKRRSIWSFGSGVSDESSEENHHKYYKTTGHWTFLSDYSRWFRGYYYKTYQNKALCFDTETLTRCLACRVSRDFFLLWEEKFYVPFPENQVEAKALAEKFMPFRKRKIEKWTEFEIWFKILSNYGINVEIIDTMIAHYLINPDMRHNMDILAETYLKYSQSLLKT
jgi:DNA polymerase-1